MLRIQLLDVLDREAEEIAQLGRSVNLGLPRILALAQHGRGHNVVAVLAGNQVGGLQKDGRAVSPGELLPDLLAREGTVDSLLDDLGRGRVVRREVALVVVGHGLVAQVAGADLFAVDDAGDVKGGGGRHFVERGLELFAVLGAGGICALWVRSAVRVDRCCRSLTLSVARAARQG